LPESSRIAFKLVTKKLNFSVLGVPVPAVPALPAVPAPVPALACAPALPALPAFVPALLPPIEAVVPALVCAPDVPLPALLLALPPAPLLPVGPPASLFEPHAAATNAHAPSNGKPTNDLSIGYTSPRLGI
jgi:hypothetical protein